MAGANHLSADGKSLVDKHSPTVEPAWQDCTVGFGESFLDNVV